MLRMTRSVLFSAVFGMVAVSGCSGDSGADRADGGGGGREGAATRQEKTAWQRVLDRTGPGGEVDRVTALQAFSVRFAQLPGVDPVEGAPETGLHSGTLAVDWIGRHWDRLTPQQRRIVLSYVDPGRTAKSPTRRRAIPGVQVASTPAPKRTEQEVRLLVDRIVGWYSDPSRLNRKGLRKYNVVFSNGPPPKPNTVALTTCQDINGFPFSPLKPERAEIVLYPVALTANDQAFEYTVAHEVFHMFQCAAFQTLGDAKNMPSWLMEGSASWAAQTKTGYREIGPWKEYLSSPESELFGREYDAIGFFAQLQQSGIDPWKRIDPMLHAGQDNQAVIAAAGLTDKFLDSWAAGYFHQPTLGPDWDIQAAIWQYGALTLYVPRDRVVVPTDGAYPPLEVKPYANRIATIETNADVVHISSNNSSGRVRFNNGAGHDQRGLTDGYFCAKDGGCKCPKGTAGAKARLPALRPEPRLALTGGSGGARAVVTGMPLKKFCSKKHPTLACAIPNASQARRDLRGPGKPEEQIAPGRYQGTITYTDRRHYPSAATYNGSGSGPVTFTVHESGAVQGIYSLNFRTSVSLNGIGGYKFTLRIDRASLSGTTAKPVLQWRPRLVGTNLPASAPPGWAKTFRQMLESGGPLPMDPMTTTAKCETRTVHRVPGGEKVGTFEITVQARLQE